MNELKVEQRSGVIIHTWKLEKGGRQEGVLQLVWVNMRANQKIISIEEDDKACFVFFFSQDEEPN